MYFFVFRLLRNLLSEIFWSLLTWNNELHKYAVQFNLKKLSKGNMTSTLADFPACIDWELKPSRAPSFSYFEEMTKKKTGWQLAVCLQCLKLICNRAEIQSRHNLKQDYGEILILLCLVPPTVSDRNITVVNTKRRSITIIRGNIHSNFKQNSFHHNSVMCWKRLSWS